MANMPTFKEGKRHDLDNYMSVSLTSLLGKIIRDLINNELKKCCIISANQHELQENQTMSS